MSIASLDIDVNNIFGNEFQENITNFYAKPLDAADQVNKLNIAETKFQ